jgi:ribosomal protein S18 acetylase RimI-like enzyme
MIHRIETVAELSEGAEGLAAMQNQAYEGTPNFRPVTGAELVAKARSDRRFPARLLLVAREGSRVLGWINVEPTWQPNIGGDIYPYVGGEIVFQPSLVPVAPGPRADAVRAQLLRRAMRELAQRGKSELQLIVPEGDAAFGGVLEEQGFREIERMVSFRAEMGPQEMKASGCVTRRMRADDLAAVIDLHNAAFEHIQKLHRWQRLTREDLSLLEASVRGYDANGMIVAEWDGRIAGYITAMTDPAYDGVHGTRRGWIGFAQMGLAVSPDSQGLGVGRALMLAAMASLMQRGCQDVELITDRESEQAMGFYRALGFEVVRQWPIMEAKL